MNADMKPGAPSDTGGPLSRPTDVTHLPPSGMEAFVRATPEECAALAVDFKLPGIHELTGQFMLTGTPRRVHVKGRVHAAITQICVVTLEAFDTVIEEDVEVDFAEPGLIAKQPLSDDQDYEPPDEIVNGHIDLGALTAEFLVLGLDPYPRKPGAEFEYRSDADEKDNPFAALGALKGRGKE